MSRIPALLLGLVVLCTGTAIDAAPLSPAAFTSQGAFSPAANVSIDTAATPPLMSGGATFAGVLSGNVAVFCFASVNIPTGVTVTVTGSRPVAILSQGNFTLDGTIETVPNGSVPGAGGSAGASIPGGGFGTGGGFGDTNGAGGAGFGGNGGASFLATPGGLAYGNLLTALVGGSGGGMSQWASSGPVGPGGGGGGAIELGATGTMSISATANVRANGAAGGTNTSDGGGGGSGGGILLHADTGTMAGTLSAAGGAGGGSSAEYGGGGGGGGRIHTVNLNVTGTRNIAGGAGGVGAFGNGNAGLIGVTSTSTTGPTITPSAGALNLGSTTQGTAGSAVNYTVSGQFTVAQTVIDAPFGVELSLNQTTWSQTVTITTTGDWGPTTVYARIAANASVGALAGNITHSSPPAAPADKAVTGTVNPGQNLTVTRNGPVISNNVNNDAQGAGDRGLVMLDFTLAAAGTAWTVSSITFTESGTADGSAAINYLALFEDTNVNGSFDAADGAAATAGTAFSAANGTYTATMLNAALAANSSRRFFLVAKLAGTATAGQTLQAEVTTVSATGSSGSITGVPTAGGAAITINAATLTATLEGPTSFITVDSGSQGPNGDGHVILDFTLTAQNDSWTINEMQFTASGTADEQMGLSFLALYVDDGNGNFGGPGADQLASASPGVSFSAANGTYTVTLTATAGGLLVNQSKRYFLVAKLSGTATTGQTFRAALTSMVQTSPSGGTVQGVPSVASSALVIDLATLTVNAGPNSPAPASVLGGTAQSRVVGQLKFSSSNDNVTLSAITLTLGGNADYAANVSAVALYLETGSGLYDAADTLLFTGGAIGGTLVAALAPTVQVMIGADVEIWVVLEIAATAGGSPAETFTLSVAQPADVVSTAVSTQFGSLLPSFATLSVINFAVTGITPVVDAQAGGAAITISGSGFALPVTLTIGGIPCTGSAVVDVGGTQITGLAVPAGTGENLDIVLTTNNLPPFTLTQKFRYQVVVSGSGSGSSGSGGCVAAHAAWAGILPLMALFLRRRRRQ